MSALYCRSFFSEMQSEITYKQGSPRLVFVIFGGFEMEDNKPAEEVNVATGEEIEFVPIKTETLIDNVSSHFDIYAPLNQAVNPALNSMLLYAKAPYVWSLRELTELTRVGIPTLYIDKRQKNRYDRYLKVNSDIPKVDPSLEPKFRIQQIQDVGAHIMEMCFLSEIDERMYKSLEVIAMDLVNCLIEDPNCISSLQGLSDHDLYTYIHSVGVGTLTAAICLTMGEKDPEKLKQYALGGLLHDVGKKELPLSVLNKAGPLTNEEWEQMKAHPSVGFQLLQDLPLSVTAMEMIKLHHEKLDGSGYPYGYTKEKIPEHVQVATVADIYNALTTTRCYHAKRSRFEALMFMKHQLVGKISPEAFKALVAALTLEGELAKHG